MLFFVICQSAPSMSDSYSGAKGRLRITWPHFSISNNKMSSICEVLPSPFYHGEKNTHSSHTAECSLTGTIGSIVGSGKEMPGRPLGVWLLSQCMCLCVGIWGIIALHAQSCHRFSGNRVWKRWKSSDTHMHGKHTLKHSIAITPSHMLTPASVQLSLPINY